MPKTLAAKLLLGWMPKDEAIKWLEHCVFDKRLKYQDQVRLWEQYGEKVAKLEKPQQTAPAALEFTETEKREVDSFLNKMKSQPSGQFIRKVIKVDPRELAIHQFMVITDRSGAYAVSMTDEAQRIKHCLGIGMEFKGQQFPTRQVGNLTIVELPHAEFLLEPMPNGLNFRERDRYIAVVEAGNRFLLWGGYHRTYAVLSQMSPEGAGGAPLVTLIAGTADVAGFFSLRSERPTVRDAVLGERPPLFRDFFDDDLAMQVQLLKQRVEVHIRPVGLGKMQAQTIWVNET